MKTEGARRSFVVFVCALIVAFCIPVSAFAAQYKNFKVAIYVPIKLVQDMYDPQYLEQNWQTISSQLKVDKVYLETYRSGELADESKIEQIKKFFTDHGVEVAGGIATTSNEANQFHSFCYTDPAEREYLKKAVELTARHFDEIILDDFFFNNTKTDSDIAAKGNRSWTDFRLALMDDVAENLVLKPARATNPKVKVVIKFPNWYEHFQGNGYDLDREPKMFDGIYTGTETRDPSDTDQYLQQYESYQIVRYFDNIKPGGNGGGWVDTFSVHYVDRYAEQLWDTMFAKAPEIMLFNWAALLQPIVPGERQAWQDKKTNFDYDEMVASFKGKGQPTMARVAGYSLEQVDPIVGKLGKPIGIKSYRPYHATGEDYLHNFLGMIGIPIDLYPDFPTDADTVLLTESAKFDPQIVEKIKTQLQHGKNVVITSGLLRAMQGKGIEDIAEIRYTDNKVAVRSFAGAMGAGEGTKLGSGSEGILIPEIRFITNDAWPVVRGIANGNGFPLLLMDRYSKGTLYVLTIPENFTDLYSLPPRVISEIKDYILGEFPVRVDGANQVALFAYDNDMFILESYLPTPATVTVSFNGKTTKLKNLVTGEDLTDRKKIANYDRRGRQVGRERTGFDVVLKPHSYLVFSAEK
jgi:hypothetical protein